MTVLIEASALSELVGERHDRHRERAVAYRLVEHAGHIFVDVDDAIRKHDGERHRHFAHHADRARCRVGAGFTRDGCAGHYRAERESKYGGIEIGTWKA